jgi:protein-disulfide isomerase
LAALDGGPGPAGAEGITAEQAEAILSELRQIRQLLERQVSAPLPSAGPPLTASVSIVGAPALGREDAPLTLVEFTDYECPFCRQFHLTVFEELKVAYIDTGRLRFVNRDLPLPIHAHALMAAEAARCAGDQGKFWPARHGLMAAPGELSPATIAAVARAVEVDETLLTTCLDGLKYRAVVQQDMADAQAAAINATPTFVLGRTASGQVEGEVIVGALPYAVFDAKIRALLAGTP